MELKDKVAIITGGSRGIGRSIALTFVAEGARVCISARSRDKLEGVAGEIKSKGGGVLVAVADISRELWGYPGEESR